MIMAGDHGRFLAGAMITARSVQYGRVCYQLRACRADATANVAFGVRQAARQLA
jgi:hypothetical protein